MFSKINVEKNKESTMRDRFYFLFRYRRRAFLFFIIVVFLVNVYTFLLPKYYQSEAKLHLRLGRENVSLDPTATTGSFVQIGQTREREINTEGEILKSRDLAEKVVDAIGAPTINSIFEQSYDTKDVPSFFGYTIRVAQEGTKIIIENSIKILEVSGIYRKKGDREKAIQKIMDRMDFEIQKDSNVVSVSYQAKSPKVARDVLEKIVSVFLDKHIEAHRTTGSYRFFTHQTEQLSKHLADTEEKLVNVKNQYGIASIEDQRKILVERIGLIQNEIEQTDASISASKAKINVLEKNISSLPSVLVTQETTGYPNVAADEMRAKLYDLQLREQDLLTKFQPGNYLIQEVRRQIMEAKNVLEKEEQPRTQITKGINVSHKQLETNFVIEKAILSSLEEKGKALQKQYNEARIDLKNYNENAQRISTLTREKDIQDFNFRKYIEKLEQARIDQALETDKISNISVIQQPTFNPEAVKPRKNVNIILGFIIASLGGMGFAYFSNLLDPTIYKPRDIEEKLGIPFLCSVPFININKISDKHVNNKVQLSEENCNKVVNSLLSIRHFLPLPVESRDKLPFTLAVTSCYREEGVSLMSYGIASVISKYTRSNVLLINANFENPYIIHRFKKPDLQEIISADLYQEDNIFKQNLIINKILIADPDKESRKALGNIFKEKGIEVFEVQDGRNALEITILKSPEILFLDVNVVGIDFEKIINILRANPKTKHIPIYYLIDVERDEYKNIIPELRKDIDVVLKKPIDQNEVLRNINRSQNILKNSRDSYNNLKKDYLDFEKHDDNLTFDSNLVKLNKSIDIKREYRNLIRSLKGSYDIVVLDMPPVWDTDFSSKLLGSVDSVIFVIESEKIRIEVARKAVNFIERFNNNFTGAILNKRKYYIPEWIYQKI